MKDQALDRAIVEAARFIKAAKALRDARKFERESYGPHNVSTPPRESGTARRASMDLTRSLADLRQGR